MPNKASKRHKRMKQSNKSSEYVQHDSRILFSLIQCACCCRCSQRSNIHTIRYSNSNNTLTNIINCENVEKKVFWLRRFTFFSFSSPFAPISHRPDGYLTLPGVLDMALHCKKECTQLIFMVFAWYAFIANCYQSGSHSCYLHKCVILPIDG